eukprot:4960062-Pyramimonas_sp.AAC.1
MPTTKPTRLAVMRRKMFTAAKEAHVWRYCQVSFQGRTWTGGEGSTSTGLGSWQGALAWRSESTRVLEYWSTGVLEYWSTRVLESIKYRED